MLDDNELLFDELYEKTKDCGRVQFINLLMEKERENQELKEQLDYLRSGEYLNQLRFERDMLQHVVDNSKVSKVDKEFIDMTYRNTELLAQQNEFIEYLENEIKNSYICDVYVRGMKFNSAEKMIYKDILSKYKEIIGVKNE